MSSLKDGKNGKNMRELERYDPKAKNKRASLSGMQLGLLREFYSKGVDYTIEHDQALLLDQRCFGPAVARGLLAFDGEVFYMTVNGHKFIEDFESKKPWKEMPSRQFSHYIGMLKMAHSISKPRKRRVA